MTKTLLVQFDGNVLVPQEFLIALIDPGDELHRRAATWVSHLDATLILTEYVWLETYNPA